MTDFYEGYTKSLQLNAISAAVCHDSCLMEKAAYLMFLREKRSVRKRQTFMDLSSLSSDFSSWMNLKAAAVLTLRQNIHVADKCTENRGHSSPSGVYQDFYSFKDRS